MENYINKPGFVHTNNPSDEPFQPEFEKLIARFDKEVTRETELINMISSRIATLQESRNVADGCKSEEKQQQLEDGFVSRVDTRLTRMSNNNDRLERINETLIRLIG